MDNYTNKRDSNGSVERGKKAEDNFIQLVESRGWRFKEATTKENMYDKFDGRVTNGNKTFKIDIKAKKNKSRWDSSDSPYIWIEWQNNAGYPGWIHGKADLIAFERQDCFVVVPRVNLLKLANKLVDKSELVYYVGDADYKVYRRKGQKDKISRIRFSDLDVYDVPYKTWKK